MLASSVGAAVGIVVVIYLAVIVLSIVAAVKIVSKAGYSGWWVLMGIVPLVNIVMFFVFAFSEWPILRERRDASDPAWPQMPGPSPGDMTEMELAAGELRKLATLRDDGFLSSEEYETQKQAILREAQANNLAREDLTADQLVTLADLVRNNVITREDFDAQKSDHLWTI